MWYVAGCGRWIVGTLIIESVCYRNSLIWGCEAVRDVLRVGFASVGIGVGTWRYRGLCGVWRGKTWRFWRVVW